MDVILNTGGTIYQGMVAKGGEKMTSKFRMVAGICFVNPDDWEMLKKPEKVEVSTEVGSITLFARPNAGIAKNEIFIPRGPWANAIISAETYGTGSPRYKNMKATIVPTNKKVLEVEELLKELYE